MESGNFIFVQKLLSQQGSGYNPMAVLTAKRTAKSKEEVQYIMKYRGRYDTPEEFG